MSRPSDPMPYKRKRSRVFAPIAFSVGKSFWEKFLGNGVTSVTSVTTSENIERFWLHWLQRSRLRVRRARVFCFEKQKPTEKPIGSLTLKAVDQFADIIFTPDGRVLAKLAWLGVFAFADANLV